MLNTDICLFYDIHETQPENCYTRTDLYKSDGDSHCMLNERDQCRLIDRDHERWEAAKAVREYMGNPHDEEDNENFYKAFKMAWLKATMNGMHDLKPLVEVC